jgi:hypothetical protein
MVWSGVLRMATAPRAKTIQIVLAVAGVIAVAVIIAYVRRSAPIPTPQPVPAPVSASATEADSNDSASAEFLPLGSILGVNSPAPPPVSISIGSPPGAADAPDLTTPAAAVYSVLSLIDEGKTDKLAACFVEETEAPGSDLYPGYLGHPIGLVDVVEDEESAEVTWEATVHTAFSRNGRQWSPGETITLTTRLVQIDGFWKLKKLHE